MSGRIKLFLRAAFLLVILSAAAHAGDDGVSVSASVDKAAALIGDRIRLEVDVQYRAGTRIDFPGFKDGRIGDFEIKDSGSVLKKGLFGGFSLRRWCYVTSYSPGKHQIPPIDIKYRDSSAREAKSVQTRALNISIESVLPKKMPPDIKDVKGPLYYFEIN